MSTENSLFFPSSALQPQLSFKRVARLCKKNTVCISQNAPSFVQLLVLPPCPSTPYYSPERLHRHINHAWSFFTKHISRKPVASVASSTLHRRRRRPGCVFPARWQVGDAYPLGALTQTQRDLAQDFVELGLLFKRKAKSTRFYPTSIAVNLIFGSSPAGDAGGGGGQRKPQPAGGLGVRWGRGVGVEWGCGGARGVFSCLLA